MTFLAGLGLGLSLIVAIGAQNVFVLRQGIRRERIALVIAICAISDAVLIAAGVAGVGAAVAAAPWLVTAARWAGAAFLLGYAALAARRTEIDDLNEALGTDFADEEFDTVGGLVVHAFGHLPKRGESIEIGSYRFQVTRADSRRIHTLLVTPIRQ